MIDKVKQLEQLQVAAMVGGLSLSDGWHRDGGLAVWDGAKWVNWDPRADDGQAFRLAVKAGIRYFHFIEGENLIVGEAGGIGFIKRVKGDAMAAARMAVFRAAVQIGMEKAR